MSIRTDDPRPPYVQLADELRAAIAAGEFKPGHRLPSTRELAETHGIAPMTVVNAIRLLRNDGLVVSHQGRGVYVQEQAPDLARAMDSATSALDPTALTSELRSVQRSLRDLDGRLTRLEEERTLNADDAAEAAAD